VVPEFIFENDPSKNRVKLGETLKMKLDKRDFSADRKVQKLEIN